MAKSSLPYKAPNPKSSVGPKSTMKAPAAKQVAFSNGVKNKGSGK